MIDGDDVIYISHAIPLNEERGIYFTKSEDGGETWMESILVFNAREAGWGMVDDPSLAITENGDLHIVWTRYSLPTGEGPLGLYYAQSSDGGTTWSDSDLVVEGPVVWSEIVGTGANTVQRVWQQESSSGSTFWHEQSTDSGKTWERIAPVSVFGEIFGNPSLSSDVPGRLHLLIMVRNGVDSYLLQHWVYDGQSWTAESSNGMQFASQTDVNSLTSNFSQGGTLGVLLINSNSAAEVAEKYQLIYTNHLIEVPKIDQTPTLEVTPIPVNTPTPVLTIQSSALVPDQTVGTATAVVFTEAPDNSGNSEWFLIAGPVVVGLIIVVVIVLIVRWIRR